MAVTYEPISRHVLNSAATVLEINSIPATYTHLILRGFVTSTLAGQGITARLNSTGNYNTVRWNASGSSIASQTNLNSTTIEPLMLQGTQTTPCSFEMQINYYSSSDNSKNIWTRTGAPNAALNGETQWLGSMFRQTSAINQITLTIAGTTFAAGSFISLYGILRA